MINQMKKGIDTRTDIELLVNIFYAKVIKDEQLGFIFQELAKVNWQTHLAIMYDFWENIILFTGTYQGNPMNLHQHLHHIAPLKESHFDQWNKLFTETLDELFAGEKADLTKQRAISISLIIQEKIVSYQRGSAELRIEN
jgi:hemoglobin